MAEESLAASEDEPMDSSNAPQLTPSNAKLLSDAEAEAVLLALGPKLEWEEQTVAQGTAYVSQWCNDFCYSVIPQGSGMFKCDALPLHQLGWPECFVDSVTAGKAACERHHATGKWE